MFGGGVVRALGKDDYRVLSRSSWQVVFINCGGGAEQAAYAIRRQLGGQHP